MKKKKYILYIGVKSLDNKYSREIICDKFNEVSEANQWVDWFGYLWVIVNDKKLLKGLKTWKNLFT
jgi:hypothetical protein